jgi:hypothetical protein
MTFATACERASIKGAARHGKFGKLIDVERDLEQARTMASRRLEIFF